MTDTTTTTETTVDEEQKVEIALQLEANPALGDDVILRPLPDDKGFLIGAGKIDPANAAQSILNLGALMSFIGSQLSEPLLAAALGGDLTEQMEAAEPDPDTE